MAQRYKGKKLKDTRVKKLLKLGKLQMSLNKIDEAIVSYKKVLDIDSNCEEARKRLTLILANSERLFSINQATVVPINIQDHDHWAGGVCYPNDMPPTFRQRRFDVPSQEIICLDQFIDIELEQNENALNNHPQFHSGTYIFAGPFFTHFGHALTESIHRLWAFNEVLHDGVVFAVAQWQSIYPGVYHPPEWFVQILEVMKIPLSKCIFVTEKSIFENLLIPEPGSELLLGPKGWYSPHLKRLQQRILSLTRTLGRGQSDLKLFLGRNHIPLQGGVAGDKYLGQLLQTEGFISLIPEMYSVVEQLSFLVSSKKIVFTEGSAIYLTELLDYLDAEIVCIPRRPDNTPFYPHIINKCSRYIIAGDVDNVFSLGSYSGHSPMAISISKNPDKIVESLRNNDFAVLRDWDKQKFLSQEISDVEKYINDGFNYLTIQDPIHGVNIRQRYLEMRDTINAQSFSHSLNNMIIENRSDSLNLLASINQASRYLEIGVCEGTTFNEINVENKVAVDPKFRFNTNQYATEKVLFLEVTSDEFFRNHAKGLQNFDLIYLDGLHTFEQTFRDFCASLSFANSKTIWLIDDTCPGSYAQAQSSLQRCVQIKQFSGENNQNWMGDVFKVVAAIHDFFPQYSFATFPNHGQTVVWKNWRTDFKPIWNCLETISRLDYSDFIDVQDLLFRREAYDEIFERIKHDLDEGNSQPVDASIVDQRAIDTNQKSVQ